MLDGKQVGLPPQPFVHKRFEALAAEAPEAVAVVCAGEQVLYGELDGRANQFAHLLIARGCGPGTKVGICLDYSIDMIVAILGTLKCGAAYVPLDPSYPAERLRLLLGQVPDLALIVVSPDTLELVEPAGGEVLLVAQLRAQAAQLPATAPVVQVSAHDLCYAVFTSGSTGTPKLAGIRHQGWYNLLNWLMVEYGLHRGSNNLVVSSFGFDLSQRSLMMPLFCGATQYLTDTRYFDPAMVFRTLRDHSIRTLHCATSVLYLLVDRELARGGGALSRLDYVFFGGEPLAVERLASWAREKANSCVLLHQYGVAECTDIASSYDLAEYWADEGGPVPVGRPVYNTQIRILDEQLQAVAVGGFGEICISGVSVGAGYLNGSGPEAERFATIVDDGVPRQVYRTGDRGCVTAGGQLVVVGRMDEQIKVRGMRIDPTDIERVIDRLAGVRQAVVVPRYIDAGDVELVAFVVADGPELVEKEIRTSLLELLPRNMVPARFIGIAELPRSPHGKVNRRALTEACEGLVSG